MKIVAFIILILTTLSAKCQVFNDYSSSYQYAGIAAKTAFLLPADTIVTTAQNVDKCRQMAKKNGIIYSYSCILNHWVPLLSSVTIPTFQEVTAEGNVTNTDVHINGLSKGLTINSIGGTHGAQVQLFDASGSAAFLQAFPADIPGRSWSQLVLQGDTNKIVTSNDLSFSTGGSFNYATIHTDGRITGKQGLGPNDFATVSQLSSGNSINNQNTSAQSGNLWISGTASASSANLLSTATTAYTPRMIMSTGTTLASQSQRFIMGLQGTEFGTNEGSNLFISRLSDAGSVLDKNAFTIDRRSGNIAIKKMAEPGSGFSLDVNGNIRADLATVSTLELAGVLYIGGAIYEPIRTVNSSTSVSASADHVMLCNTSLGGVTVTLPNPASYAKLTVIIKKITADANAVTITTPSGSIDGSTTPYIFSSFNQSVSFINNGTNWYIYQSYKP